MEIISIERDKAEKTAQDGTTKNPSFAFGRSTELDIRSNHGYR